MVSCQDLDGTVSDDAIAAADLQSIKHQQQLPLGIISRN
jgi:hypothetical protein